jgi:HEAT repeat protein
MASFQDYLEELRDDGQPVKAAKLPRLSHLSDEERPLFLKVWSTLSDKRRRRVVRLLVDLAEDNVELNFDDIFLPALSDSDARVRAEAIRGLWEYDHRDLIEPLIHLLSSDGETDVRAEAALALGRFVLQWEFGALRDRYFQRVEGILRQALNTDEDVEVRARSLEALGACSLPWVRTAIRQAYNGGERRLQVSAVNAMGRNCDPGWLPILFQELSSGDSEMRYEAALACGSLADEAAVPRLAVLLEDEDPEVRAATIAALGEIGGREAKAALMRYLEHPSRIMRDAVREALSLASFDEDPLPLLHPTLDD